MLRLLLLRMMRNVIRMGLLRLVMVLLLLLLEMLLLSELMFPGGEKEGWDSGGSSGRRVLQRSRQCGGGHGGCLGSGGTESGWLHKSGRSGGGGGSGLLLLLLLQEQGGRGS